MKKIVLGNDFNLIIPVSRKVHTSTGDVIQDFNLLPACTDLQVNLVNFNETISLPCSVDVEHTSRLIANVDSSKLNIGNYALEVKGKIYGNAWRSNEYEQIAFVNNNASADEVFDGEIIEGESSVEVDHVFIILPPTAGFTEIMDQASNVDINLNDANLEITRRTGEKKSFDLNTVNVEIGEGIKSIRRLEASPANKEVPVDGFIQSNDFDSFLLSQGDYCGVFIPLHLYDFKDGNYVISNYPHLFMMDPFWDDEDNLYGSMMLDVRSECTEYDIIHTSSFRLHITLTFYGNTKKDQELIIHENFIRDPSTVCGINIFVIGSIEHSNDKRLAFFFSKGTDTADFTNTLYLPEEFKYTSFYFNIRPGQAKFFGALSKANWVIEKNDGSLVRLNTTDNLVIGGSDIEDDISGIRIKMDDDGNRVLCKPGSLTIFGTGRFKDIEVGKSLSVGSSLKVGGSIEATQGITTRSSLKAGETTLEGTLHVEEHDIKTKSVYPAKTGGSYLKDSSKGHVSGNYVVNKGNLGKGAHNYDKAFIENIFWSDCTDPGDYNTSLNGKGTVTIFRREGIGGYPTLYVYSDTSTYRDGNNGVGFYYNEDKKRVVIESQWESSNEGYDTDLRFNFNNDGTIGYMYQDEGYIFGNGIKYNKDNRIPAEFISLFTEVVSQEGGGKGYCVGNTSSEPIRYYLGSIGNGNTLYIEGSGNGNLELISDIDETYSVGIQNHINSPNMLYATDGSFFDIRTKADLVDGKIPLEQLGNVDRETVDFIADATTTEDVVTKFNQLLANLRSAGIMKSE